MEDFQKRYNNEFLKIVADLQALTDDALDVANLDWCDNHIEYEIKEIQTRISEISDMLETIARIKQVTND